VVQRAHRGDPRLHARGVTERDGWYEATVSCTGYSNTGGETNGTETVAPHHADWFTQTYVYSVKEHSLIRVGTNE